MHATFTSQDQEVLQEKMDISNSNTIIEYRFVTSNSLFPLIHKLLEFFHYLLFSVVLYFLLNICLSCREPNENIEEVNISKLVSFLEKIKEHYQNGGIKLRTALDKFIERYEAAESKSISRLVSFLYDINRDLDPTVNIRSGSMIHVQVESVKRRKSEGSGRKRKLPTIKDKENSDPQIVPSRKKRKIDKKEHNLSKNIGKNRLN